LLLAPKLRPRGASSTSSLVSLPKSASNNFRKWFLSPTAQLNFGFITEGKLTVVLITPYSWGSQLVYAPRPCTEEEEEGWDGRSGQQDGAGAGIHDLRSTVDGNPSSRGADHLLTATDPPSWTVASAVPSHQGIGRRLCPRRRRFVEVG
jgi:hypothetical protein